MVAQNLDWVVRTLQVRPPFLECADDCKDFLIVDFIIAFRRTVFFRVKGHRVQDTFVVVLGEDAGRDVASAKKMKS